MPDKHSTHWLEREDFGDVTVVRIKTEKLMIDDHTRAVFEQIYQLVDEVKRTRLIVNFSEVTYISSLGLGKLVMLNRKCESNGGAFALCCLDHPLVAEVLRVSRLDKLFTFCETEKDALKELGVNVP